MWKPEDNKKITVCPNYVQETTYPYLNFYWRIWRVQSVRVKAGCKWDIYVYPSDESTVYISVFLLNIPIHPPGCAPRPSIWQLVRYQLSLKANIDWLFTVSFQPIIDIRLSSSYDSDYSFLPILNISPFKIMCISHAANAARYATLFHRRSPKLLSPRLPTSKTPRVRPPPITSGNPRKRVFKCGHISIINYSNESFEWLKIGRTLEIRQYIFVISNMDRHFSKGTFLLQCQLLFWLLVFIKCYWIHVIFIQIALEILFLNNSFQCYSYKETTKNQYLKYTHVRTSKF